jgi:aminomethyltransferase
MTAKLFLSPRIRKSPYFEATRRYGAKEFSVYNKMYLPMGYSDPETEFWNLVNNVNLWDVAAQRIVEITGPDALSFTNLLTPRDLTKCAVGQCKYVVIASQDGGILNDPVLLRLDEDRFWLSRADGDILMWAQGVAVNAHMDVEICEPEVAPLQVQGPKSRAVMENLFDGVVRGLAYYACTETELNDSPVIVSRTGWSAELGYEIYLRDSARADELWEAVMAAGKPFGIAPAATSRIRRIEAGILDYGVDMNAGTNPFEVGLDRLVDLDQEADFIGKATLRRVKSEGVERKLSGIEIHGEPLSPNEDFWPVRHGGRRIGQVTSCVYSPRLGKNIGYAMLALPWTNLGTDLMVESPNAERAATVVEKPFVDPKKTLARAS